MRLGPRCPPDNPSSRTRDQGAGTPSDSGEGGAGGRKPVLLGSRWQPARGWGPLAARLVLPSRFKDSSLGRPCVSHGDHTAASASQGVLLGEPRVLGIQKVPVTSMEKGAFCSQPRTPPCLPKHTQRGCWWHERGREEAGGPTGYASVAAGARGKGLAGLGLTGHRLARPGWSSHLNTIPLPPHPVLERGKLRPTSG